MMKDLCMIACISKDGGLGYQGDLLWRFPEDQKFFRETTMGFPVVMGSKTFTSIGRALPKRENIVLSRHPGKDSDVKWVESFEELSQYLSGLLGKKFIIGGASLYEMFLPEAEVVYLTEVDAIKPADVFFPQFERGQWQSEVLKSGEHEGITYQMVKYTRKERNGD